MSRGSSVVVNIGGNAPPRKILTMHIVTIAPPWLPVPPPKYGGIERVVCDLVEASVSAGHRVTLFAPDGSNTSAELIPTTDFSHGLDISEPEKVRVNQAAGERAYRIAQSLDADIIHDHTDYMCERPYPIPIVRTIHGPATEEAVYRYYAMSLDGDQFIAISQRQRELFEEKAAAIFGPGTHIRFAGVVHNPIDVLNTPFYSAAEKSGYAAFVGRCHWEKGPTVAINVARMSGIPMKMAMRVSKVEQLYFDHMVKPLLDANKKLVELVGELGGQQRSELYGRARALVFSSVWHEPFGLTIVEALAHGTPVVALRRGSAPEIILDGVTGALCENEQEMAEALPWVMKLDPAICRAHAMTHFERSIITTQYLQLYLRVCAVKAKVLPIRLGIPSVQPIPIAIPISA